MRVGVVTPLCFDRRWLPDGLDEDDGAYPSRVPGLDRDVVLRAAFVPRPIPVSGREMAAGVPKLAFRMVPPGAVYFCDPAGGQTFGETDARALRLAAIGWRTEGGGGGVVSGACGQVETDQ